VAGSGVTVPSSAGSWHGFARSADAAPKQGEGASAAAAANGGAARDHAGLRRALAGYYERRFGVRLDPETEVVATLGSKEGLANLAQAISSPGDTILVPNPSYPIHQFGFLIAGIDNSAHVGGLAFGLLAAVALDRPATRGPRLSARLRGAAGLLIASGIAALALGVPEPGYDWSDELTAREDIRQFIGADANIANHWNVLLEQGRREGMSFAELAKRIDTEVADRYEASFEKLAAQHLDPRAPSVATLELLKHYAEQRRAASHEFAEALRAGDSGRIRQAIDKAKPARLVQKDHAGPVSGD